MLSPMLFDILRIGRPAGWLFPGKNLVNPLTTCQLNRVCHMGRPARWNRQARVARSQDKYPDVYPRGEPTSARNPVWLKWIRPKSVSPVK